MLSEPNLIVFEVLNWALIVSDLWQQSTFVKGWLSHMILSDGQGYKEGQRDGKNRLLQAFWIDWR